MKVAALWFGVGAFLCIPALGSLDFPSAGASDEQIAEAVGRMIGASLFPAACFVLGCLRLTRALRAPKVQQPV